ncbi:class D sortase [Caldicoprobacter algeriensis]|uniref:class D sortase n=1 Tax=Caldicoprobacter algeriensis TaxID=699281 RepID=UPI00207A830D|nr:class D sortase [Caldicoprobacter algeriensis]MCM8901013.1 class D sortase [Caldicoprobacter algeriensis]
MKTRILGTILVFAGLSIIIYGIYIRYDTLNTQQRIIQQFEDVIKKTDEADNEVNNKTVDDEANNNNDTDNIEQQHADGGLLKIEGIDVIGVMEIPKIDLKVAVAEGTDKQTLKKAVGHFEGTAMPGEIGNFAVAGHRSYTYNEFFNRLDEMEIGDEIRVKTTKGEFVYEVTDIFVVEPHEVWVLDPTPEATITLVTCTPIRVATHRLIVKGKLKN